MLLLLGSKREISIACASFMVGGLVGVAVTLAIKKREKTVRYMEAVQIKYYSGAEVGFFLYLEVFNFFFWNAQSVSVVEDAIAPYECGDRDVLINVKAASVQIVDAHICSGYGRTLRRILRKLYKVPPPTFEVSFCGYFQVCSNPVLICL